MGFIKKYLYLIVLAALILQGCSSGVSSETGKNDLVKITVQLLPFMSYSPFYIAEEEGYFEDEGLEVEFVTLFGTDAIIGLSTGDIDVASTFLNVSMFSNISQADNLRIVADKGFISPTGCTVNGILARKDLVDTGKLDDVSQLGGRVVEISMFSIEEFQLHKLLESSPYSIDDLEIISLNSPFAELEAFESDALDISFSSEPWVTRTVNAGHSVLWKDIKELTPDFQFGVILFGPNLYSENSDVGQQFMNAYLKAIAQYNEGKTDRNMELMATFTELDQELLDQICWPTFREGGKINVESVIEFQEWAVKQGYLDVVLTKDQFWYPDFVDNAN